MSKLIDQEPNSEQFEIVKHIRAGSEGVSWITDLGVVFPIYDWYTGDPEKNINEQVAKYQWESNETFEKLVLTISRGGSSRETFFRATLDVMPLKNRTQQRTLYGSDFSEINILKNNRNGGKFARLITEDGGLMFNVYPNGQYSMMRTVKEV